MAFFQQAASGPALLSPLAAQRPREQTAAKSENRATAMTY